MHSLIATVATGVLLLLQAGGLDFALGGVSLTLAIAVAFVGLPHGALDHRVGKKILCALPPVLGFVAFFASYLAVATVVLLGWYVAPLLTTVVFFGLSAWHFGLEEDERTERTRLQWAAMVSRGGMVIWIPIIFQGAEINELLAMILPSPNAAVGAYIVGAIQLMVPVLIALTIIDAYSFSIPGRTQVLGISAAWQHRIRVCAFAVLFAIAHPLVSFGLYFCGWHSIRGLMHLHQQFGGSFSRFSLSLVPISAAAIALFAVGFLVQLTSVQITPSIIRTVFVGLSAVAIPHLLLHVLSDSLAVGITRKAGAAV